MKKEVINERFQGNWLEFYRAFVSGPLKSQNGTGEYLGQCPFHADTNPSLSVNQKAGLWNCFAGCGGGDPYEFFARLHGLSSKNDFPKVLAQIGEHFGLDNSKKPPFKIVKTYDYPDEGNELLFQVCRMDPKDFRQRRPDGSGGWIWQMNGTRRVLYRLPDLLKSPYCFFLEGEKDADRARSLGLVATTNPGGAGKIRSQQEKHRILEPLRDKKVYLIPDNDQSGADHMKQVAGFLRYIAAEVRIIALPVPEKGDFSDWCDKTGDEQAVCRLRELIKATSIYRPITGDPHGTEKSRIKVSFS